MRRIPRSVAGTLLVAALMVPSFSALAQFPAPLFRGQPPPRQKVVYQQNQVLSAKYPRQEEMRVELALLDDFATFPYDLRAWAAGETLELRGFVPNEMVRQRAVDLACRNTSLRVCNNVNIQPNRIVSSPPRSAHMLQWEAAALLQKNLGGRAEALAVGVQSQGRIVVAGPIESMEYKLAVSRLFRQLAGCHGVVNKLIVQPILPDASRIVQVRSEASMCKPPSPLEATPRTLAVPPPGPRPAISTSPVLSERGPAAIAAMANSGRSGFITFDDGPPSPFAPGPGASKTVSSRISAKLQHQIQSICGPQVREVKVESQGDDIVLVKVMIPNRAVEDQVIGKISAIPEMASPKVCLQMYVEK